MNRTHLSTFVLSQCTALLVALAACSGNPGTTTAGEEPSGTVAEEARACGVGRTACRATCVSLSTDPANCGSCGDRCPTGATCRAGRCTLSCPTGEILCGTRCVSTQTDPVNCGACGVACPAGATCKAGACVLSCPSGETLCGTLCASTQTDPVNCGACGAVCTAGRSCQGGVCQ